ncbi:hypothetical protein ES702_01193 [subsurface metagenome]
MLEKEPGFNPEREPEVGPVPAPGEEERPYFDTEKELFNKLSDEEREKRIKGSGDETSAIQAYGLELALKSIDKGEVQKSPEEQAEFEKMVGAARNVISAFEIQRSPDNKKGENLVIVTDPGANKTMIEALYEAGREAAGADCRVVISEKPTGSAQPFGKVIDERLSNADCVLLMTSISRTHSPGMAALVTPHPNEAIAQLRTVRQKARGGEFPANARFISITQTRPEILTEGAALENLDQMRERVQGIREIMRDVESVHITSKNGTDLELDIKQDKTIVDDGKINVPGKAANFPFGEWSSAVDLENTNGTLVVDGVSTPPVGELDEPIILTIEKGMVTDIKGGEAAERLKTALDEANRVWREKHPEDTKTNAYKVAELGIGVNSKAFRYTPDGHRVAPPTSLEGEKGLGTIHIALGKNALFGVSKEDPDFNAPDVHIDNVIMETSVVGKKEDGSEVTIIEKGKAKF